MSPVADARRVECREGSSEVHLSVGEYFYFEFGRHCSVGEDTEFSILDPDIVVLVRTEVEYLHPERLGTGIIGADEERGRWYFRAVRQGTTKVVFRYLFRGDVDFECTLHVHVH